MLLILFHTDLTLFSNIIVMPVSGSNLPSIALHIQEWLTILFTTQIYVILICETDGKNFWEMFVSYLVKYFYIDRIDSLRQVTIKNKIKIQFYKTIKKLNYIIISEDKYLICNFYTNTSNILTSELFCSIEDS